jgi:hypothetical protein
MATGFYRDAFFKLFLLPFDCMLVFRPLPGWLKLPTRSTSLKGLTYGIDFLRAFCSGKV